MQAVIKRLMTDVPFGVLLSGGLDSSLVASITARHLAGTKAARQWGTQLHSFCVGLEVCYKFLIVMTDYSTTSEFGYFNLVVNLVTPSSGRVPLI